MSIPEDQLTQYLNGLFGRSEPGKILHELLVATAGPGDTNAFGLPDPKKLKVRLYAIAPDCAVEAPEKWISKVIFGAINEARSAGERIHFAGLAIEAHQVFTVHDNEVTENLVRRLQADHRLQDHPDAVEVTRLYAATSDGRRWSGHHILTGPQAGTMQGPTLLVGGLTEDEQGFHASLIRAAVSR